MRVGSRADKNLECGLLLLSLIGLTSRKESSPLFFGAEPDLFVEALYLVQRRHVGHLNSHSDELVDLANL